MHHVVTPAELKLVSGSTLVTIRPANATAADAIACKAWDLGSPEVRVTPVPIPGGDGTVEGPGYLGPRTVTFDLQILGGPDRTTGVYHDAYWYADTLTAMCHPQANTVLKIRRDGGSFPGQEWEMRLRGNPWTLPMTKQSAAYLSLSLSFTAPLGMLESPLRSLQSMPGGTNTGDWVFPVALPDGFGNSNYINPRLDVTIGGSAAISPTIYLSGPATNPYIETADGEVFAFQGLTLAAGDLAQIDMGAGTIIKGRQGMPADEDNTLYHLVDFTRSTFWRWKPGIHIVRLHQSSGTMTIQWRERLANF